MSTPATVLEVEAWFLHARSIRFVVVEYEWTDGDTTFLLDGSNLVVNSTIVLVSENTMGIAYKM